MSAISNATPEQLQALLNGPALKPPPGVIPDFTDPSTSHRRGVAVEIVSLLLSAFAVAMHIYTKARFMHQMAAAAYVILLGCVCLLCFAKSVLTLRMDSLLAISSLAGLYLILLLELSNGTFNSKTSAHSYITFTPARSYTESAYL